MRGCRAFAQLVKATAVVAVLGLASLATAATIVVPSTIEAGGVSTVFRQLPRTYQSYIDETQLASITQPVNITGIQFRLSAGATNGATGTSYPAAPINFASFLIQFSNASAAIATAGEIPDTTTSYAANQGGTVTNVFNGPLTIAAAAFPNNVAATPATPNAFGAAINFTTPYLYTPGEQLLYTLSHTGFGVSQPQAFFAVANFGSNVADAVSSLAGTGTAADFQTLPTGFTSPYIVQLITSPIPEPTSLALAGLAGFGMLARVRRK
jgi:hypothetical protein